MTTGAIIVQDALCQRGVLAVGVAPSTDQQTVALRFLNRMLQSWGNDTEMIYVLSDETFATTPGTIAYTTDNFDSGSGRPVGIDSIFLRLGTVDYDVDLIDIQTYNAIPVKSVTSVPSVCYYDYNFPVANFNFYPAPYAAFTAHVACYQRLSGTDVSATTDLVLPDGYEKAIIDNLAIYLNYGNPVTPQMRLDANESRNVLKRKNYVPPLMDSGFSGGYSINNDFPYRTF